MVSPGLYETETDPGKAPDVVDAGGALSGTSIFDNWVDVETSAGLSVAPTVPYVPIGRSVTADTGAGTLTLDSGDDWATLGFEVGKHISNTMGGTVHLIEGIAGLVLTYREDTTTGPTSALPVAAISDYYQHDFGAVLTGTGLLGEYVEYEANKLIGVVYQSSGVVSGRDFGGAYDFEHFLHWVDVNPTTNTFDATAYDVLEETGLNSAGNAAPDLKLIPFSGTPNRYLLLTSSSDPLVNGGVDAQFLWVLDINHTTKSYTVAASRNISADTVNATLDTQRKMTAALVNDTTFAVIFPRDMATSNDSGPAIRCFSYDGNTTIAPLGAGQTVIYDYTGNGYLDNGDFTCQTMNNGKHVCLLTHAREAGGFDDQHLWVVNVETPSAPSVVGTFTSTAPATYGSDYPAELTKCDENRLAYTNAGFELNDQNFLSVMDVADNGTVTVSKTIMNTTAAGDYRARCAYLPSRREIVWISEEDIRANSEAPLLDSVIPQWMGAWMFDVDVTYTSSIGTHDDAWNRVVFAGDAAAESFMSTEYAINTAGARLNFCYCDSLTGKVRRHNGTVWGDVDTYSAELFTNGIRINDGVGALRTRPNRSIAYSVTLDETGSGVTVNPTLVINDQATTTFQNGRAGYKTDMWLSVNCFPLNNGERALAVAGSYKGHRHTSGLPVVPSTLMYGFNGNGPEHVILGEVV